MGWRLKKLGANFWRKRKDKRLHLDQKLGDGGVKKVKKQPPQISEKRYDERGKGGGGRKSKGEDAKEGNAKDGTAVIFSGASLTT